MWASSESLQQMNCVKSFFQALGCEVLEIAPELLLSKENIPQESDSDIADCGRQEATFEEAGEFEGRSTCPHS